MNCGFTRAKGVAANKQLLSRELHQCFGIIAVRLTGLAVALIAELRHVYQNGTQRRSELGVEAVTVDQRCAGMLEGARGAAVLQALSGEALGVVAGRELVAVADVPVALAQINVLVKRAVVIVDSRIEVIHRSNLIGSDRRRQRYQNGISGQIALSVIIEEEEQLVLFHRPADVSTELVEVISRLQWKWPASALRESALQAVDGIVRVESTIAKELEGRPM